MLVLIHDYRLTVSVSVSISLTGGRRRHRCCIGQQSLRTICCRTPTNAAAAFSNTRRWRQALHESCNSNLGIRKFQCFQKFLLAPQKYWSIFWCLGLMSWARGWSSVAYRQGVRLSDLRSRRCGFDSRSGCYMDGWLSVGRKSTDSVWKKVCHNGGNTNARFVFCQLNSNIVDNIISTKLLTWHFWILL